MDDEAGVDKSNLGGESNRTGLCNALLLSEPPRNTGEPAAEGLPIEGAEGLPRRGLGGLFAASISFLGAGDLGVFGESLCHGVKQINTDRAFSELMKDEAC